MNTDLFLGVQQLFLFSPGSVPLTYAFLNLCHQKKMSHEHLLTLLRACLYIFLLISKYLFVFSIFNGMSDVHNPT